MTTYNFKIAIPTYKRAATLKKKSLSIIENNNFPLEQLFIFLANDEELNDYKNVLPEKYHSRLVVGVKGLANQRNYMSFYFDINEPILYMDDDIRKISYGYRGLELQNYPLKHFNGIFKDMKEEHIVLSGIYPVHNSFFMKNRKDKGSFYICGGLYCIFNKHDITITNDINEDFERTLKVMEKYGSVVRYNNIAMDTKGFRGKGGMNANERDPVESLEISLQLMAEYPEFIKSIRQLKNGFFNPVLI